jgi:2-keto-4-pentenoate hydratase/2-oxohepta-3-ene-1,7-dioic acid hydratase in catechol pathway
VNAGKNFERSGSIGPWMVTADEITDPQNLRLSARVDGETRQDASTGDMIFSVAEIISYLSQSIELRPGDVIATGSPEGTGGSFDPPKFLEPGQQLDVEIEGIGVLTNTVVAEADHD